ncbi:MAG TPA: hypothetical protein VGZ73_02880 [Bryobacteraceae bacterium]|nr:hypothetical protein [Bryobacteraceae bacterium]
MKAFPILVIFALTFVSSAVRGQPNPDPVRKMEISGDTVGARATLARAVADAPNSIPALTRYAEFLDRYGDPACREAYAKLLAALRTSGDTARAGLIAGRLASLDLLAGDRIAAARDLETYRSGTGKNPSLGTPPGAPEPREPKLTASIPGPLRSFARMAAISPDATPEEVLPALARNVVTNGYQASHSNDALEQTEYLKLVHRYLSQAHELAKLAGDQQIIKIENCESSSVAELIRILGFRMRGGCGSEVVLETVNAARAFLTTDSGFPVNELEQALRTNRPFSYDYHPAQVSVIFGPEYWMGGPKEPAEFIEAFLSDPAICRLYLGLSKLDRETAEALRKTDSYTRLKAYAHVLDFFGGMFEIRDGKAVIPGGQRSAAAWTELTGVAPDKGAEFFDKLMSKDDGWLASLYDALARIHGPVQEYLTDPARMKRFYTAVRGRITSPGPARPVFRSNTDMMLLTTRLRLNADGKPHIPGSLEVWKNLFINHPQGKYDGKLTRLATTWKEPDDVLEALFALCRKAVENEPLKIFMAISDLDKNRVTPLDAPTVDRLARDYRNYGSQYSVFSESRSLSDKSINQFLDTAESMNKVANPMFRSDLAGSFQSLVGLWQIFVRQQTIPESQADAAFSGIMSAFAQARTERDLFDASRNGVKLLLAAAPAPTGAAVPPQERMVDLLAGAAESDNAEARDHVEQEIGRIMEAQRIISLDTLFQLADHIEGIAKGEKLNTALVAKLASRISEIQLPRAALSANEKNAMGFGYWTDRHIEAERKLNLRSAIEKAGADAAKLNEVRGLMAPLLRDTLLAFNYAHYAPPGAQILYTNPVFVRSHDFLGMQGTSHTWRPTETYGTGWPSNAGGRLVGSLSSLPYALAEAEQNFLIPAQTQALIWGDLVPQMILSAKIPRWWNITSPQVHWVGLHLRYGRELLAESAFDADLRGEFLAALGLFAAPARTAAVARLLEEGDVKDALDRVTPSELFSVARELAPKRSGDTSCLLNEMKQLAENSVGVNYTAISRAFGTPKPTLANSWEPDLENLRTFPALMGYSSRIMAESWESNTLYWVALADELSMSPAELNVRIPEWTQKLVEQIFASHLEDWPALLKSLRVVGDDVRTRSRAAVASEQKAALQEFPNR